MPFSTRPRTSWTPPNMSSSREEDPRARDGAADNSPSRAAGATAPHWFVGSVPHAKLRRTDLGAVATAGWSASCQPNSGGGIRQFLSPPHRKNAAALMRGAHRRPVGFAGWGAFVVDGATPAVGGTPGPCSISAVRAGRPSAQGALRRPQRHPRSACAPGKALAMCPQSGQRREQPTPHQRHDRGDSGLDEPVPCRGVPEQVGIPEQFGGGRLFGTEVENFRRDIHSRHIAKIIGAQTHFSLVGSHYSAVGAQARRRRALRSTTSANGPSPSGSGSCWHCQVGEPGR